MTFVDFLQADLIISALNTNWNMHLRYVEGSQLIARLIEEAIEENQCNRKVSGESGDQSGKSHFVTTVLSNRNIQKIGA